MVERLRRPNKRLKDLGVKQAPFVVLIGAAMPSVLAEISFVTNPQEARLLKSNAYRQKIAEALFNAVRKYQGSLKRVADRRASVGPATIVASGRQKITRPSTAARAATAAITMTPVSAERSDRTSTSAATVRSRLPAEATRSAIQAQTAPEPRAGQSDRRRRRR